MKDIFEELEHLPPGQTVTLTVFGYAGYHGPQMAAGIVRALIRGLDLSDAEHYTRALDVAKAVASQLPGNHPAWSNKEFMEAVKAGDKKTFSQLLSLSPDTVFTVPRLLETLENKGGVFKGWVNPELYDPATYISDTDIIEKIHALPAPRCWAASELVTAAPPEHIFYAGRAPT